MATIDWPPADALAELHRRLTTPDPVAPADFAAAVIEPLTAYLRTAHPAIDDDLRVTAAGDAVLSVIRNPAVFNPARGELAGFLRMAANGDLRNLLTRERNRQSRQVSWESVEDALPAGNEPAEEEIGVTFDHPAVAAVIAALSDAERQAFELMRVNERRTEVYAPLLGLGHLPVAEQQAEVKRVKERIIKRLRRAGGKP